MEKAFQAGDVPAKLVARDLHLVGDALRASQRRYRYPQERPIVG